MLQIRRVANVCFVRMATVLDHTIHPNFLWSDHRVMPSADNGLNHGWLEASGQQKQRTSPRFLGYTGLWVGIAFPPFRHSSPTGSKEHLSELVRSHSRVPPTLPAKAPVLTSPGAGGLSVEKLRSRLLQVEAGKTPDGPASRQIRTEMRGN